MKIKRIHNETSILKQIRTLWRANSAYLGFFPDGAFAEYAQKGQIIGAFDKEAKCVGYLLYRISNERAHIVHLCVDKVERNKGIARELCEALFNATKDLLGTCLWCRRDYDAAKIWQELRFVALADKPGRNIEGKELTYWKRDHQHPTLFENTQTDDNELKLRVVIDASVFFDLCDQPAGKSKESHSLIADWLVPSLELCLTDEIWNEINRCKKSPDRERSRTIARAYQILTPFHEQWKINYSSLVNTFSNRLTERDKSDYRHLAKTLAADVQFFVTRDGPLLRKSEELYKNFGISIVRPSDLVISFNDLKRETAYQPARFDRTTFQRRQVKGGEVERLTDVFQNSTLGEGKTEFQQYLSNLLAYPHRFETLLVIDSASQPVALISHDRDNPNNLNVPLLRLKQGSLASTLARNLLLRVIRLSAGENRPLVTFCDPYIDKILRGALEEDQFVLNGKTWTKVCLPVVKPLKDIRERISIIGSESESANKYCSELMDTLKASKLFSQNKSAMKIELLLWPAKFLDFEVPSFIIPIKPKWAEELFDEELACQNLFGAPPELGLSREAVYYRSKNPAGGLVAPSRILWYVSSARNYEGSMHVRGCSYIEEVQVGKPKELFRKFRRLGVYEWKNIFDLAKRDVNREIMAIRFSHSETFSRPISWENLQTCLEAEGCPSRLQSPHRIPSKVFLKLYKRGTNR